jgi:chaperonin cofactor prefoldin
VSSLESQLSTEQSDNAQLRSQIDILTINIESLSGQITTLQEEKSSLQTELQQCMDDKADLEG